MLLKNKVAVIFAAGGAVGGMVSRVFVQEGATVFLSGRKLESVAKIAKEIYSSDGRVTVEQIDALNQHEVNAYLDRVVKKTGKIDVVFNAIGIDPKKAGAFVMPSVDVSPGEFLDYTNSVVLSQFLTAQAAARHMVPRRSGVVIFLTATPARGVAPLMAGHSAGHAAVEGLIRCLATEWSPSGIRVVGIRSGGMPETPRIQEVLAGMAKVIGMPKDMLLQATKEKALLKRMVTVTETAQVAAFLASDSASSLTGAIINSSCGEVLD